MTAMPVTSVRFGRGSTHLACNPMQRMRSALRVAGSIRARGARGLRSRLGGSDPLRGFRPAASRARGLASSGLHLCAPSRSRPRGQRRCARSGRRSWPPLRTARQVEQFPPRPRRCHPHPRPRPRPVARDVRLIQPPVSHRAMPPAGQPWRQRSLPPDQSRTRREQRPPRREFGCCERLAAQIHRAPCDVSQPCKPGGRHATRAQRSACDRG